MKSLIFTITFLLAGTLLVKSQSKDQLFSNCIINADNEAKYLKDFRIQLGKTAETQNLRFKVKISLWKNTKYRFTQCNAEGSKGQLIINVKDDANNLVLSSYDKKSGKTYSYVDLICNKSGVYQLYYDFKEGQEGSGIGVISMVK
jgi:hypothetical protein